MTDSGAGESVVNAPGERLPEGWVRTTLGELITPTSGRRKPTPSDDFPYLGMDNVESHTGRVVGFGEAATIKSSSPVVQPGYLLYGRLRPYLNKVTVAEFEGLCSGEFIVFPPVEGVDSRFLLHRMLSPDFVHYVMKRNPTGDRPRAHWEQFSDFPILLPPLSEQRRIVAELDEQLARVEAGEAAVSSAVALRQPLRDAFLDRYVLGRDQGSSAESVREIQAQPSRKIPYGDLVPLPHGWKWRVARDVCPLITSGATPEASLMSSGFGEIPFLKVYNIDRRGGVDFSIRPTFVDRAVHEGKLKKSRVVPGDVLTNIVGPPLGKTAAVPKDHAEWNINQAIVAFRAGPDLLPEWLRFALLSPYVIGMLLKTARATAGQFNVALSTCRELPIPVPPLDVQREMCEFLTEKMAELDSLDEGVDEVAEQPTELRGALLHAAFSGTLVPQDPADEPASVQLDRMRARRQAAVKPARKRTPRKTTSKPASSGQRELPL